MSALVAGVLALLLIVLLGLVGRRPTARIPTPDERGNRTRRSPHRRPAALMCVAMLIGVAVAAVGVFPLVLTAGVVVVVARCRARAVTAARRTAIEAAMPDTVELLVLCIHAGLSPTQAVVAVASRAPPAIRPVFTTVELGLHRGQSLATALGSLSTSAGTLGREVAAAISAAERDGLALAPTLDRLATDARRARRRLGEAEARRLPVRLTFPLVACTLPAFVLLAIAPALLGALSTLRAQAP